MSTDEILARIKAQYRPYDTLPAFEEGFTAYQASGPLRRNPYDNDAGYKAQAWDRGANAAMLYARALAHLDAVTDDAEANTPAPGWLERLIHTGRC
jgi:hypothetical protein